MKPVAFLLAFTLAGCSVGGHYSPQGPHPHVTVAGAVRYGPLEVLHSPVSNGKPATDLTVLTANVGPVYGDFQPVVGLGWQVGRSWGACDVTGHNCEKHWTDGWVAAGGVQYRKDGLRADLRVFRYDNSPVGAETSLPVGLEAVVLLFGFAL